MTYHYSFKDLLQRSERITWRVEDLIEADDRFDFSKPFMPEALARTAVMDILTASEQLTLNHIRGHTYLAIFGLVEEFILPFVLDYARPFVNGEDYRARAYLEFAAEEAKHIHLFRAFGQAFAAGFKTPCDVIGPPSAIAAEVLSKPALSVALLTLHIEWMSQRHYLDSIQDDLDLEPRFKSLLLHHWMEEHQHAQLDTLMVEALAADMTPEEIQAGFDGYLALGGFLDAGLQAQAEFDLDALERARGQRFRDEDREVILAHQHQANRWTYIGSGMSHPKFLDTVAAISPTMRPVLEAAALNFF